MILILMAHILDPPLQILAYLWGTQVEYADLAGPVQVIALSSQAQQDLLEGLAKASRNVRWFAILALTNIIFRSLFSMSFWKAQNHFSTFFWVLPIYSL